MLACSGWLKDVHVTLYQWFFCQTLWGRSLRSTQALYYRKTCSYIFVKLNNIKRKKMEKKLQFLLLEVWICVCVCGHVCGGGVTFLSFLWFDCFVYLMVVFCHCFFFLYYLFVHLFLVLVFLGGRCELFKVFYNINLACFVYLGFLLLLLLLFFIFLLFICPLVIGLGFCICVIFFFILLYFRMCTCHLMN